MIVMEFSIFPLGKGESVGQYVARCIPIIESSGLDYQFHAMGTIVEGEFDDLVRLLKACFEALAADCDRIECAIRMDYRKAPPGRIQAKVESVERALGRPVRTPAA